MKKITIQDRGLKSAEVASRAAVSSGSEEIIANFDLSNIVSHLIRRAHFRAEELFAREFSEEVLTPRQKALLITSYQHPGAQQAELAQRISLDRNTFSEMMTRMLAKKYVRRERSADDARAYSVFITDAGVDVLLRVLPRDRFVEEALIASLPEEYRPLFIKCLKLIVGSE